MSQSHVNDLPENGAEVDVLAEENISVETVNAEGSLDTSIENSPEKARIAELEAQIKDIQARANADMYNFQKRVERETDNAKKFALEKFAGSLLDVVDNLERAIAAAPADSNQGLLDGVQLTHKALLTTLEKHHIRVIDPAGQAFDADQHQAVGIDPNTPEGQVANVLQKGYSLSGRLLRPAMVTVGQ
ncbi:MAG TPA: nucleotide exchange factor GrpE [Aquirhabdus sp.]